MGKLIHLMHSGGQNLKFPEGDGKNYIKMKAKREFLPKVGFNKIDFGFWCHFKTNDRIYKKYTIEIFKIF